MFELTKKMKITNKPKQPDIDSYNTIKPRLRRWLHWRSHTALARFSQFTQLKWVSEKDYKYTVPK